MLRTPLALALFMPVAGAQTLNTGLIAAPAPTYMVANDDLLAFLVPEIAQHADLDGDGDMQSLVLHVRAGSQGAIENLQLPVADPIFPSWTAPQFALSERLVAVLVLESQLGAGGTDLNNDSDKTDRVVHVWDRATHLVTNTGLAGVALPGGLAVVGDSIVMGVPEALQGMDLDGDGFMTSTVACTWTAPGVLRISGRPITVAPEVSPSVAIASNRAYFREREAASHVDRNGDGDMLDDVLQEMDLATGAITNLALDADDLVADGPILAFRVGEANQGAADLNGDGDTADRVQHLRIASIGVVRNLQVAVRLDQSGRSSTKISGHLIAMRQRETPFLPATTDFNGDGDSFDFVLFVHDARANVTWNTHLGMPPEGSFGPKSLLVDGTTVLLVVPEYVQGSTDLNGDLDALDFVYHLFSAATGTATNLGLANDGIEDELHASPRWFTFVVGENAQGNTDLNGNGVFSESVLFAYDRAGGMVQSLGAGIVPRGGVVLNGDKLLYAALEYVTGDQNGDGDTYDSVVRQRDILTGVTTNYGLATGDGAAGHTPVFGVRDVAAVHVSESATSSDLNGDGDLMDKVLALVRN